MIGRLKTSRRSFASSGRGSLLVSALVVLGALCTSASALGLSSATDRAGGTGVVKACGYMTSSAGGSAEEYIKFSDPAAPGTKGTFVFTGPGVTQTRHLTLNNKGLALTSFPVASAGSEMIAVSLATKPATKAVFHFALRPVANDVASKVGCTPR